MVDDVVVHKVNRLPVAHCRRASGPLLLDGCLFFLELPAVLHLAEVLIGQLVEALNACHGHGAGLVHALVDLLADDRHLVNVPLHIFGYVLSGLFQLGPEVVLDLPCKLCSDLNGLSPFR